MEMFLTVWIVVAALMAAFSLFYAGYDKREDWARDNFIFSAIMISFLWPIVVLACLFIAPFYGIYLLGKYVRTRR